MDLSGLYGGTYVEHTYGDRLEASFRRILSLPLGESDNAGRVARMLDFAAAHFPADHSIALLDVGAGLGVFPYGMKQAGWECTALDPDPQVGRHLAEVVGVRAVTGDFFSVPAEDLGDFDVVTLNKVIEHVQDPVAMLKKAAEVLDPNGFLYVEVPDVAASREGPGREEYFIEHLHVFSPASLAMTVERAGLHLKLIERIREPSGKFTLRAFMARQDKAE